MACHNILTILQDVFEGGLANLEMALAGTWGVRVIRTGLGQLAPRSSQSLSKRFADTG